MGCVIAGSIGSALIIVALVVLLVLRQRKARQVPDRAELLRRGALAAGRISRGSRHAQRGSMRRGGLGEGSEPNQAASFGPDGGGSV
jgi:hypothetical protein